MNYNRCVIIGAGEIRNPGYIKSLINENDFVICADGGIDFCAENGIIPDIAVGDFDSVKSIDESKYEKIKFPVEKDESDMLLALDEGISRGFKKFLLLGCTGGRFDHTYANILLLRYGMKKNVIVEIADEHNLICLADKKSFTVPYSKDTKVSFFAFGESVKGLCLTNSKYTLNKYDLNTDDSICLGNDFINDKGIDVEFESGVLMIILSTDI